jgi:class 3 adenylate cyclase
MNLSVSSIVVFVFAGHFVTNAVSEREKANRLLLNILPEKAAQVLKTREGIIAEQYDDVSVLFADIVDFTQYSNAVSPDQLVSKLNEIFFRFDELTDKHGLEKIKTIGDAYMVAGGLAEPKPGHAETIAALALDMLSAIKEIEKERGGSFSLRIGIHCGPVVAGVIGKRKFAYDLWGDTVNIASRMESSGTAGAIQVSDAVYQTLKKKFLFKKRGAVDIKGLVRSKLTTYRSRPNVHHATAGFGPCPNASLFAFRNSASSSVVPRPRTALRWGNRPNCATISLWRVHPSILRST